MMRSRVPFLGVCAVAALVLAGCGGSSEPAAGPSDAPPASEAPAPDVPPMATEGTLVAAEQGGDAVSYTPEAAPVGARLVLEVMPGDGTTTATFRVEGMVPDRGYAVHAHTDPCGPTGDDAGPHWQNVVDPAATPDSPSADPAYANPQNEFWFDLRTDATGAGQAVATVPYTLTESAPASIIVHEDEMTMTEPGMAGMAGDRAACLSAAFR